MTARHSARGSMHEAPAAGVIEAARLSLTASGPDNGFGPARPNAARIYDYLLGGKDHYDADRQAAKLLLRAVPDARQAARDNRAFLGRVVRYLAGVEGIGQFLDIGSGLPAAAPVHEIARQVRPDTRVAYADHDPVVVAHARALLAAGPADEPPPGGAVLADLRDPQALLDAPGVRALIDFSPTSTSLPWELRSRTPRSAMSWAPALP